LKADPVYPPRTSRLNEGQIKRLEALRSWRKKTAHKMGVESDVVLPRDLMFCVAESNPHNREELTDLLSETPWRLKHFGNQILEAIGN
jgi:ribonuclease D